MIAEDPINSRWWGAPVAKVTDPELFTRDAAEREHLLAPFTWAEFRAPLNAAPDPWALARAGFAFSDAQIGFRIRLPPPTMSSSSKRLRVRFADEQSFDPGARAVRSFAHERFHVLPGATDERVAERYLAWARQLVAEHPGWCAEVLDDDGTPQGWFCCQRRGSRLDLTLSALYADATISGLHLYEASLAGFATKGPRVGDASFSVTNHDVHGIYAQLGARFTSVTGFWLWRPVLSL